MYVIVTVCNICHFRETQCTRMPLYVTDICLRSKRVVIYFYMFFTDLICRHVIWSSLLSHCQPELLHHPTIFDFKREVMSHVDLFYTSYDVFPHKDVLVLGSVDIPPHLGKQIPQNRNFGGWNRHFEAKRAKYSNFHIIKTTAWIPTKFCKAVKTTKYASSVVQKRGKKSKMADGRQLEKSKIVKSQQPYSTNFDEIWHGDASRPSVDCYC